MTVFDKNTNTFQIYWEKKRQKGLLKYAITDGALGWGVTFFIFFSFFLLLFNSPTRIQLLMAFLFSIIGGIVSGILMWYINQKRFKKYENNTTPGIHDEEIKLTLKKIEGFKDEIVELPLLSDDTDLKNSVLDIKTYEGKIKEVPFVNKAGRKIAGVSNLFFETAGKKYFIKSSEGAVIYSELKKLINKPVKVKALKTFGLWDTDDPNVQSRIGEYFCIIEVLTETE
jgi:hypothetical protein